MKKLEKYLLKLGETLGTQRHLQALSAGMMMILPLIIIGALFMIVANPPINVELVDPNTSNAFMQFMLAWKAFAVENYGYLTAPFDLTMGAFGLMSSFTIAFVLARNYKTFVEPVIISLTSMVMFLLVCATPIVDGNLTMQYLGGDGIFTAIIISMLTVELFRFFEKRNVIFKLHDSVPKMVENFINALIPVTVSITIIYGLNLLFIANFGMNFPTLVMTALTPGLDAINNVWVYMLISVFHSLLWFVGINGTSIIFPLVFSVGIANTGLNAEAIMAGEAATNAMNLQLFRYMMLGGAGNTLGLVILMMRSKSVQLKTIGRIALIPGICSINEPITFGVPVAFNPILAIPYIVMPTLSVGLGYLVQTLGFVTPGFIIDPSFIPFFFQGYLSGLDWRNVVFMFFLVFLSVLVYYPFFKIHEKNILRQEIETDAIKTATDK